MHKNILEVKNLSKNFGNFEAVKNISFNIEEGEIVGFLGPNGAGKTTTIQMLLGILTPSNGEIYYFDKSLKTNREEIMEYVNFSSTYINLPWKLTVRENLKFISYLYNIKNRNRKIDEIIELFKLKDFENKSISKLSAGQNTRVNLAKAFINDPKVLLLDEPTASMDPEIAKYLRDSILERKRHNNISIIWTSHNMSEIEEVCDRVIFINNGEIIDNDKPENLIKKIKICHVNMYIPNNMDRMIQLAAQKNLDIKVSNKKIIINIQEKHLSEFLIEVTAMNIKYDEISIEKPTLEDYFLHTAQGNKL